MNGDQLVVTSWRWLGLPPIVPTRCFGVGGASCAITTMRPHSDRDRLVHQYPSLADALARQFSRRYPDLLVLYR